MVVNSIGVSLGQYGHKVSEDAWTRYRSEHKKTTPQPHKAHVSNHRSTLFGKNHRSNQSSYSATSPSSNAFWKKQIEEMNKREYIREVERFNRPVKQSSPRVTPRNLHTGKVVHAVGDVGKDWNIMKELVSVGVSMIPGIGPSYLSYSCYTGMDPITNETMSRNTCLVMAGLAAVPLVGGLMAKGVKIAPKLWRVGKFGFKSSEQAIIRARVEANVEKFRKVRENDSSNFSVLTNRSNALELELKARTQPLSNTDVRYWYNQTVEPIPKLNEQWIRHNVSLEGRAINSYGIRHDARLQARSLMANPADVELLQTRDLAKYGNPNGPTFEYLYDGYASMGYSDREIYQAIIDSSRMTNPEYNAMFNPK